MVPMTSVQRNAKSPYPPQYLSLTLFAAYLWAYAFSAFSALVGLRATRLWPDWLTWPLILLGFGSVFMIVVGLRPILLDLTSDLGIREKLGIFLLCMLVFISPKLITPRASLLDCMIALQVPMVISLLRRESFMRLYIVNFMLAALAIFVEWQTTGGGFEWAVALPLFLCGCFAADHFFFEIERYPSVDAQPVGRSFLQTVKYALVSIAGGAGLYALTPSLSLASEKAASETVVQRPGGVQTVSTDALIRLVWDTFLLLMLLVVALAILQYLKRRFRRSDAAEKAELGGGVMKMVRKAIRPRPKALEMPRGFSPREQILRGYWSWCDEMERFGQTREDPMTAKEFARAISGFEQRASNPVANMTRLFEAAKYGQREMTRAEAESFFKLSRRAVDILIEATRPT